MRSGYSIWCLSFKPCIFCNCFWHLHDIYWCFSCFALRRWNVFKNVLENRSHEKFINTQIPSWKWEGSNYISDNVDMHAQTIPNRNLLYKKSATYCECCAICDIPTLINSPHSFSIKKRQDRMETRLAHSLYFDVCVFEALQNFKLNEVKKGVFHFITNAFH